MASGAHLVELAAGADATAAAKAAMARGGARLAVPDRRLKPAVIPNDTFASKQWYLADNEVSVSAHAAWNITTGSSSVVVRDPTAGAGRHYPGCGKENSS
ncbi:MAG: hypothetical protein IPI87_17270 [Betaproteobacteria bacterium]|nr:hypothetical protein [Betaproteobacteria bacterium]